MKTKTFVLAFIIGLFAVAVWADAGFIGEPSTSGVPVSGGGGGCDDCSGTLILSVHFEDGLNPTDITDGTPCGCTDGTDTTVDLTGGAAINSTAAYVSDGSYSADIRGEDDALEIDSTGLPSGLMTTGTYCADYYKSNAGNGYIFRMVANGPIGTVEDGAGSNDNTIRMSWGPNYKPSTAVFNDAEMVRICFSWDASQSDGSDRLAVKVGANSWESIETLTLTVQAMPAVIFIGNADWQYGRGYLDNIKIYSDYQHAE
jgi:hypothetical protein